jgi:hypothetical protein
VYTHTVYCITVALRKKMLDRCTAQNRVNFIKNDMKRRTLVHVVIIKVYIGIASSLQQCCQVLPSLHCHFRPKPRPFWHPSRPHTINTHFLCFFRVFSNKLVLKNLSRSIKIQLKLYLTCSRMLFLES